MKKIQLLTRVNKGKRLIPSFLAELSEAIGGQIDLNALATLPDTDALLETFRAGYQRSKTADGMVYQRYFHPNQKAKLFEISDCIGKRLPAETAFLSSKNSHFCGAVKTDILACWPRGFSYKTRWRFRLSRFGGRQQGLLMDQNIDNPEQTYELTVWGHRWSSAVSYCDSGG